jgi:hypothetical protein
MDLKLLAGGGGGGKCLSVSIRSYCRMVVRTAFGFHAPVAIHGHAAFLRLTSSYLCHPCFCNCCGLEKILGL